MTIKFVNSKFKYFSFLFFFIFYITKMDLSINTSIWKYVVIENKMLKNITCGGQLSIIFVFYGSLGKEFPRIGRNDCFFNIIHCNNRKYAVYIP